MPPLLPEDEPLVVGFSRQWESLRSARVFVTGGTGFVGRWLVSAFVRANREHDLGARLELLTRDPRAFSEACPGLAGDSAVTLLEGDVRDADLSSVGCTHVIHAATPSDERMNTERPEDMLDVIKTGTERALALAGARGVRRFLLVSSGAVYQPPAPGGGYCEDSLIGPEWPEELSAYHAGKRVAETMAFAAGRSGQSVTVARLFAFVGPHLPLDRHFAIGNFIGDALAGRPVHVKGDGSPLRSYLYAGEMAVWLWTMLADRRAAGGVYNVGSEDSRSLAEIARVVAEGASPSVSVSIARESTGGRRDIYVPRTRKARSDLGLSQTITLEEGVRRTLAWHRALRGET